MEQNKPLSPEPTDDDHAEAVVAADDTGLLSGEQEIVNADVERALQELD